MPTTIRIAVLLVGLCAVPLRADIEHRDDSPPPVDTSKDCIVQVVSTEGRGTAWRSVSREACLARAHLAGDQPPLTTEMIRRGPGGPLAISGATPEHCSFIPYNMHLKGRGMSRKFWCYRTDAQGRYYSDDQAIVPDASGVSAAGFLVDARGQTLTDDMGRARRPEIIKVKYSTGGRQGSRGVHGSGRAPVPLDAGFSNRSHVPGDGRLRRLLPRSVQRHPHGRREPAG